MTSRSQRYGKGEHTALDEMLEARVFEDCPEPPYPEIYPGDEPIGPLEETFEEETDALDPRNWEPDEL